MAAVERFLGSVVAEFAQPEQPLAYLAVVQLPFGPLTLLRLLASGRLFLLR